MGTPSIDDMRIDEVRAQVFAVEDQIFHLLSELERKYRVAIQGVNVNRSSHQGLADRRPVSHLSSIQLEVHLS